jgi:YesN/AraC family two-component response regulator
MKLFIKNMACESCKVVVKESLQKLKVQPIKVELGEAEVKGKLSEKKKKQFNDAIKKVGLELMENSKGILTEKIKMAIIEYVNHPEGKTHVNFSVYLSKKLHHEYSYLSSYFSSMQATTIEQYMIALKTEKVKEMIINSDRTLKEIAYDLHYSSVSHLSKQFKKVTGLAPTHFKKLKENRRIAIQKL